MTSSSRSGSLSNRVVLITGASAGAGEATVLALAERGAHVFAAARRLDRLTTLTERIAADGGSAFPLAMDVSVEDDIERAMQAIRSKFGRLDALVNNAGVIGRGSIGDPDISNWRASISTNLYGPILVTHAAVELLKASSCGRIINVSSTAARDPKAGNAAYVAAKGGLNVFTESIRKELLPAGIRVSLVVPGLIASDFYAQSPNEQRDWMKTTKPLSPADVAHAIAYILEQPPHVSIRMLEIMPTGQV